MSRPVYIELGQSGVSIANAGLAVYDSGAVRVDSSLTLTWEELGSTGAYALGGVPVDGEVYHVTWSVFGAGGYRMVPERPHEDPEFVIYPARVSGLSAGDFDATLARDGSDISFTLAASELTNGDYKLSGWSSLAAGSYVLASSIPAIGQLLFSSWSVLSTASVRRTTARQLVESYWLTAWMGPDLDQRIYCPGAVMGVHFDSDAAADVAPWTTNEVRKEVGWVRLSFDDIDQWRGEVTSGLVPASGGGHAFEADQYVLTNCQFAIRTPRPSSLELAEKYADAIESLFIGLTIHHADPFLRIRNLGKHPPSRRGPIDDGPWRLLFLDVKLQIRERRQHKGVQEVQL